jgi:hypothetical protein
MKRLLLAFGLVAAALVQADAQCVTGSYSPTLATYSAAGTTQGTATVVTSNINIVNSVGAGSGVILIGASVNNQTIYNRGANPLLVYPNSGATIENYGTNVARWIAVGGQATYVCATVSQCYEYGNSFQ